jgi:hypothetical protein
MCSVSSSLDLLLQAPHMLHAGLDTDYTAALRIDNATVDVL